MKRGDRLIFVLIDLIFYPIVPRGVIRTSVIRLLAEMLVPDSGELLLLLSEILGGDDRELV